MVTYLESKNFQKQKIELTILIEKNYNYQKLKKDVEFIFQNFQYKIIQLKIKKFHLFTFYNFFDWVKIFKINKLNRNFIKKILIKKKINLNVFNEFFYSNDLSSKYINYMFVGKKIFFFHGVGDINIFVKQNYLKEVKNLLFFYINYVFNKVETPKKNSLSATILKKFISEKSNKKNILNINQKLYRSELLKFQKEKINQIKFNSNKNFILYILKIPKSNIGYSKPIKVEYLQEFLNFQFTRINNYIKQYNTLKGHVLIIKTKNNIKKKNIKVINQLAKNSFKDRKIRFLTNNKYSYVNAEIFASHKKCSLIVSNFSTTDFLVKILKLKVKILQCNQMIENFSLRNKLYTKQNFYTNKTKFYNHYKISKQIKLK